MLFLCAYDMIGLVTWGFTMPFTLQVPEPHSSGGWKIKIREKERLEPPHVTILFKTNSWRLNLRTGSLLDPNSNWSDVPKAVQETVRDNWTKICDEWNRMYPGNPI